MLSLPVCVVETAVSFVGALLHLSSCCRDHLSAEGVVSMLSPSIVPHVQSCFVVHPVACCSCSIVLVAVVPRNLTYRLIPGPVSVVVRSLVLTLRVWVALVQCSTFLPPVVSMSIVL